mgnify:CR=1 FL=1
MSFRVQQAYLSDKYGLSEVIRTYKKQTYKTFIYTMTYDSDTPLRLNNPTELLVNNNVKNLVANSANDTGIQANFINSSSMQLISSRPSETIISLDIHIILNSTTNDKNCILLITNDTTQLYKRSSKKYFISQVLLTLPANARTRLKFDVSPADRDATSIVIDASVFNLKFTEIK